MSGRASQPDSAPPVKPRKPIALQEGPDGCAGVGTSRSRSGRREHGLYAGSSIAEVNRARSDRGVHPWRYGARVMGQFAVGACLPPVGCQNSITPLTLEFAGACRSSRCEF